MAAAGRVPPAGPAGAAAPAGPVEPSEPERRARRLLGSEALGSVALGVVVLGAARPVGRAVGLPAWIVRLAALGSVGWGTGVGVAALAEDWPGVTRQVVLVNGGIAAALAGHAVARGRLVGRLGVAGLAAAVGGLAYQQARAMADEQGPVVAR